MERDSERSSGFVGDTVDRSSRKQTNAGHLRVRKATLAAASLFNIVSTGEEREAIGGASAGKATGKATGDATGEAIGSA